jgi:hypothetical protein
LAVAEVVAVEVELVDLVAVGDGERHDGADGHRLDAVFA